MESLPWNYRPGTGLKIHGVLQNCMRYLGWVLMVVIVGALLFVGFLARLPMPLPKGSLTFIAFTNTGQRTEALFWFTNTTAPDFSWDVRQIRRLTLDGWVLQPPLTNGNSVYTPASKEILNWDVVGIPVATNNAPFEITIACTWPVPRSKKVLNRICELRDSVFALGKRGYRETIETMLTAQTGQ
jgi:hypothetical protein